jgi:type I site-specific restriction endonuclease
MNEAETRAELIDPKLKACGWGIVEGSKVLREYNITADKIQKLFSHLFGAQMENQSRQKSSY